MPTDPEFQLIRVNLWTWELHVLGKLWDNTTTYEIVAQIVEDKGLFYIEYPVWNDRGKTWSRQTRGYYLKEGAVRAAEEKYKSPPEEKIKS